MSRKSSHTDKKLIHEGRKLLILKGASSLSIREVALAADVNLGMFNYYFKTKENFIGLILGDIYNDFIADLEMDDFGDELELLKNQMMVMAKFARNNRTLILSLFNDILSEEKSVQKFIRTNMKKHLFMVGVTVKKCQDNGLIVGAPLPLIVTQIAAGVGISNLVPEFIKRLSVSKPFGSTIGVMTKELTSDKALEFRVNVTLKGLLV